MMRALLYSVLLMIILPYSFLTAQSQESSFNPSDLKINQNFFIENKGQWPDEVKFLAKINGLNAWITNTGIVYDFYKLENEDGSNFDINLINRPIENPKKQICIAKRKGHVIKMIFGSEDSEISLNLGKETHALEFIGVNRLKSYQNYFIGNDSTKWKSNVALYDEVLIKNVFEGIDYRFYFENDLLRYDLNVQPYANVENIRLEFIGHDGLSIGDNGDLLIGTIFGEVRNQKLLAFQNGKNVECQFSIENNIVGFKAKGYNESLALRIDPLVWSTFIGGNSPYDYLQAIALDINNNVVIAGSTVSSNFPTSVGVYDESHNGSHDNFVTKLSSDGSSIIYSTFIGASRWDACQDMILDDDGNPILSGHTLSPDYPTTNGAYDQGFNGGFDTFITKFNSTGTALIFSTYIGGGGDDSGRSIVLDSEGNILILGDTKSSNYPTTNGAYDETFNGGTHDICVTKLNSTGTDLIFSTFIGGSNYEYGSKVAIDESDNFIITGVTPSTNYPTTIGAISQTYSGGIYDIVITKLNSNCSSLIWSSYFGGSSQEEALSVIIDKNNFVLLSGVTGSANFPTTIGVFDESHNGGYDGFVTKINTDCTDIVFSSFLGGIANDAGRINIDKSNNIVIVGYTASSDFPVSNDAYDKNFNGVLDLFIAKFNSAFTTLKYSTYLGGSDWEAYGKNVLDEDDNIYILNMTKSSDFPISDNAFDKTYSGNDDGIVTKFKIDDISDLIAHYPFSGNANDESGRGNHGTVNGATLTTDRFGNPNSAYSFDGDDYIEMDNEPIYVDYTFSAWFYCTIESDFPKKIIGSEEGNKNKGYGLYLGANKVIGYSWTGPVRWANDFYTPDDSYQNNRWHHIIMRKNQGQAEYYLDGVLIASGDFPSNPVNNPTKNFISAYHPGWRFTGKIDDIRIYDRAISDEEIEELYREGGWDGEEEGPIAYYPFNGNANDESGRGNHGTVHGATLTTDRFGNPNSAYSFDGDDDIAVPDNSSIDLTNKFTFSLWMNQKEYNHRGRRLLDKCSAGIADGYCFDTWDGIANVGLRLTGPTPHSGQITDDRIKNLNTWYHVVATFDNGFAKLFVNGQLTNSRLLGSSSYYLNNYSLLIGKCNNGKWNACQGENFYGSLDDIRIYDRAISDEEIEELYREGGWDGEEEKNTLWSWGNNQWGQLGDGTTISKSSPEQIGNRTEWTSVSCGGAHTLAIKTDGTLWAWGYNYYGQLGNGNTSHQTSPVQIGSSTNWAAVSCGGTHTLAIKTDGTLWAWGGNWVGQLGDETTTQRTSPVQFGSGTDWKSVSCGGYHTLGIKTDGMLWVCGNNWDGQLGDGSTINKTSPVQIGSDTDWKSVFGGRYHTLGIKTDGTLWAWGDNSYGQLGDGTITQRKSPLQIGSGTDWKSVSCGYYHTLAIKTDGTLWAWGYNSYGQLGNGNTTWQTSPVQIGSGTNWAAVSCGHYHTLAIKTDGTLWAWGDNSSGKLGDGTNTNRTSPVQVGNNTDWVSVSCGGEHTIGLRGDDNTFQLISPINDIVVSTQEITFEWSDIGAVSYDLIVDNNSGLGSPEISKYHISELSDFAETEFTISGNWLSQNKYYWKVTANMEDGSTIESNIESFLYEPEKADYPDWVSIYRAYNSDDVDHFYCTSEQHLSAAENGNYNFEKVDGFLSVKPFDHPDLIPVFRFYVPISTENNVQKESRHYYTVDEADKDNRILSGWIYEGISGYTYSSKQNGLIKMHHLYLDQTEPDIRKDNFYTTSDVEALQAQQLFGYSYIDYFYVSANGEKLTEKPTDLIHGGYSWSKTCFAIPAGRMSLGFSFGYHSYDVGKWKIVEPHGPGWGHSYSSYIYVENDKVSVLWNDGRVHEYPNQMGESNALIKGIYNKINKISESKYEIKTKGQIVYTFEILNPGEKTAFLKSIRDRNNNTITCQYDWQVTAGGGYFEPRLIRIIGPKGRFLDIKYSDMPADLYKISHITDGKRNVYFEYDPNGKLKTYTDAMGFQTKFEYEEQKYRYYLKKIIKPENNSIEISYDNLNMLSSVSSNENGSNSEINFDYDLDNSLVEVTDQNNNNYEFHYESVHLGLLKKLISPQGTIFYLWEYPDHPWLPSGAIDSKLNFTSFKYDNMGNVTEVLQPLDIKHSFTYNSFNDLTSYTDPKGTLSENFYDGNGNLNHIKGWRGSVLFENNSNGTVRKIVDPMGREVSFGYDLYGNRQTINDMLGNVTQFNYDSFSRMTKSRDARGNFTNFEYDDINRLIYSTDPLNQVTEYKYDKNSNIKAVKNGRNHETKFDYDDKDLTVAYQNPGLPPTLYDYYEDGRIRSITDPDGRIIDYQYFDSERKIVMNCPDYTKELITDGNGNVATATKNSSTDIFSYDDLNRIISHTDMFGNTIGYIYDKNSNVTKIIYPDPAGDKIVKYTYYPDNLIQSVEDWNNNKTTYIYYPDGSLNLILLPNGVRTVYEYDAAGRLILLANITSTNDTINSYRYEMDADGNHILVEENEPYSDPPFLYETKQYKYDNANRISKAGSVEYNFDNSGNMTQRKDGSDITNYVFDSERMLTNINGSNTTSYVYDAFGTRKSRAHNGITTRYVVNLNSKMGNVLIETDETGNIKNYYIHGIGLVSRISPDMISTRYYHSDFRGSTIAMTDQAGNITHKYCYDEFGNVLLKQEENQNPFRYVGSWGVMDEENGLLFMRARYYDTETSRFISEDPIWSTNLYTYAGNNPVMYIDPEGKNSVTVSGYAWVGGEVSIEIDKDWNLYVDVGAGVGKGGGISFDLTTEEYSTGLHQETSVRGVIGPLQGGLECDYGSDGTQCKPGLEFGIEEIGLNLEAKASSNYRWEIGNVFETADKIGKTIGDVTETIFMPYKLFSRK